MLRFGADEPPKRRARARGAPQVWSLVVRLGMTLAAMAVLAYLGKQLVTSQAPGTTDTGGPAVVTAVPSDAESAGDPTESPAVPQALELSRLSEFQDHTRNIAAEPYYYLLDLARRNPAEWLEQHARRDVTYAQLFHASQHEPEKFRGQLIFLKGRLHRLVADDAGENELGITSRYEGWLCTDESRNKPYVVIVSDPPTGMPLGAIYENVSVAGYFLGWYRYRDSQDKPFSAPIIVGRRFVWHRQSATRPDAAWSSTYGLAIGAAIALVCLGAAYLALRRRPPAVAGQTDTSGEAIEFDEAPREERRVVRGEEQASKLNNRPPPWAP